MELYALRQVLEVHAASQIPLPVPQARLAALVAVQREHDAAVADGDARRVFRSNQRFHRELFGLLDNTVLGQAIEEYARRTHPIRFGSLASPGYRERARQEHWAMIHALRDGDRDALMALCRDHLLPSRDAYLASERASSAPGVLSADTPARNPLSRHGVVANPRDTYGYRCGLRLALTSMDEFRHADPTGQHTSPCLLLERTGVRPIGAGAIAAAHFQRHGIRIDDGGVGLVVHHHAGNAITAPTMSSWITMNGTEPQ